MLTGQSNSSIEVPSSHVTTVCVELTKAYQVQLHSQLGTSHCGCVCNFSFSHSKIFKSLHCRVLFRELRTQQCAA